MSTIKLKTLNLLQQNHQSIWQSLKLAILNHIQFNLNQSKSSKQFTVTTELDQWVKKQIQNILSWISDSQNKWLLNNLKKKENQWNKQRKQWQITFQNMLLSKNTQYQQQERQIAALFDKISGLQAENENIKAKNTVLQSVIKMYSQNHEHNLKNKMIKSHTQYQNQFNLSQNLNRISINNNYLTEQCKNISLNHKCIDVQTMTVQILTESNNKNKQMLTFIKEYSIQINECPQNQFKYPSLTQNVSRLTICESFSLSVQKQIKQKLQKEQNECIKNKNSFVSVVNLFVLPQQFECIQNKQANLLQVRQDKRQTKVSQNQQEPQQEPSSYSSSSSSYILECDRGTQTQYQEQPVINNNQNQPNSHITQNMLIPILLKLSNLEKDLQNKNKQIDIKNQQIKQLHRKISQLQRKQKQYKQDIRINQQISQYIKQQLQQNKKQYEQLEDKYKQLLDSFIAYMEIAENKHYLLNINSNKKNLQYVSLEYPFSPVQSYCMKEIDDQLLTIQSQQQQPISNINISDTNIRTVLTKYFTQYMKLQVQNNNNYKKQTLLLTVISILGINDPIAQLFINKMCPHIKIVKQESAFHKQQNYNMNKNDNSLHQIFFKYLTKQL